MATKKTSKLLSLDSYDFLKAALVSALLSVLYLLQEAIDKGDFSFEWLSDTSNLKHLGMAAIAGFVGYLIKNLFTPAKEITKVEATFTEKLKNNS